MEIRLRTTGLVTDHDLELQSIMLIFTYISTAAKEDLLLILVFRILKPQILLVFLTSTFYPALVLFLSPIYRLVKRKTD